MRAFLTKLGARFIQWLVDKGYLPPGENLDGPVDPSVDP